MSWDFLLEKNSSIRNVAKKEEWKRAQALLKEAGLKLSVTELPGEAPICGCGAKLDIRDFGPQGKIDRNFYYIDVPEKDYEKARTLLICLLYTSPSPRDTR